jgi:hypothetical protein
VTKKRADAVPKSFTANRDATIIEDFMSRLPKGTPAGWPIGNEELTLEELPSALRKLRGHRKMLATSQISPVDHSMSRLEKKTGAFLVEQFIDNGIERIQKTLKTGGKPGVDSLHEDLRLYARDAFTLAVLAHITKGDPLPTHGELRIETFRLYAFQIAREHLDDVRLLTLPDDKRVSEKAASFFKSLEDYNAAKTIKWSRIVNPLGLKNLWRSRSGPKQGI